MNAMNHTDTATSNTEELSDNSVRAIAEQVYDYLKTVPLVQPQLIRSKDAPRFLGIEKTLFYSDVVKETDFPPQIKLGKQVRGWRRTDLEAWLSSREREA